jgi:hypothetical protein
MDRMLKLGQKMFGVVAALALLLLGVLCAPIGEASANSTVVTILNDCEAVGDPNLFTNAEKRLAACKCTKNCRLSDGSQSSQCTKAVGEKDGQYYCICNCPLTVPTAD